MQPETRSHERSTPTLSGWLVLPLLLLAAVALATWLSVDWPGEPQGPLAILGGGVLFFFLLFGFFIVEPNMSRVLVLFGNYKGTVRGDGFHWVNPLMRKHKVSLRAHNMSSKTIKVNDQLGNPIEIGAVVVWQVSDTAQATFDVDDYHEYVEVQTETAVRHLAKSHPYDDTSDDVSKGEVTLRENTDIVTQELQEELQLRFARAGTRVIEARISHLAYASEIASAMLQRQQAAAVIAARRLIVEGAVGMVEHALLDLGARNVVELDDERRATLVGNLLVVLCSHMAPTPILNTGSLYN